jgi:hypothetical protein
LRESSEAKKKDNCYQGKLWLKYSFDISSKLGPNGLRLPNKPRNLLNVAALSVTYKHMQTDSTTASQRAPKTATYPLLILNQGGYITALLINECVTRPLYSIQRRLMTDRNMYVAGHDLGANLPVSYFVAGHSYTVQFRITKY